MNAVMFRILVLDTYGAAPKHWPANEDDDDEYEDEEIDEEIDEKVET